MEWLDIGRLLAATVAGALIGLEREFNDKPAGLRTNVMICLGAAFFTLLSERIALTVTPPADPTRIAAQIVTGIGFLGAGAIVRFGGTVIGLTTAATVWTVASIGMAFGAGHFFLGSAVTLLAGGILRGLVLLERLVPHLRTSARLEIQIEPVLEKAQAVEQQIRASGLYCASWFLTKKDHFFTVHAVLMGPRKKLDRLQNELVLLEYVRALNRL